jgi:branched-chain amino acid transport system substrate-binding protein
MKKHLPLIAAAAIAFGFAAASAQDIKVGVTLSATGPAASLGIPERNTFQLAPETIGGRKVQWIVLDDASDTTAAVKNMRKLIGEDKVDVVIGSTITPNSLAMVDVAAESERPMISMAASARIVEPVDAKRRWVFKTPQNDQQMAAIIVAHMLASGMKNVAYIGFADAYGEGWWSAFSTIAEGRGLKIVANERYQRADTSVTGQILKLVAARPDAVLIGGSGTPAALPQKTLKERGYAGQIYQTHGVANRDFLRVCGKDCEGTWVPVGPLVVAPQLPDSHPVKKSALEYVRAYEQKFGKDTAVAFGGYAWDATILLKNAIPVALKKAQPGTKEFRAAVRDALEGINNVAGAHGIFNMSPHDHLGLDQRSAVMAQIKNGDWVVVK